VSSPEFLILPRSKAEAYQPAGVEVCISITNPGEREAVLSTAFKAILRLAFRDIREPSDDPARVLFAPAHACEIARFLDSCGRDSDPSVLSGGRRCDNGWPLFVAYREERCRSR
jgi:hypothetical protein